MKRLKRLIPLFLLACTVCFAQEKSGESSEPAAVWKVVNFAILAAGLGYLLVKNLPPFFSARSSSIQKEITDAQKLKQESEQRSAAIMKRVSNLAADIEAFRVQSRAEMEREGERIREEAAAHAFLAAVASWTADTTYAQIASAGASLRAALGQSTRALADARWPVQARASVRAGAARWGRSISTSATASRHTISART